MSWPLHEHTFDKQAVLPIICIYHCFKRPSGVKFWHKLTLKCVDGTAPNVPGSATLSWAAADRGPFNNVNIFIEGEAKMMANSWVLVTGIRLDHLLCHYYPSLIKWRPSVCIATQTHMHTDRCKCLNSTALDDESLCLPRAASANNDRCWSFFRDWSCASSLGWFWLQPPSTLSFGPTAITLDPE